MNQTMTVPANFLHSADGTAIPIIGFGTSQMTGKVTTDAVVAALRSGYRHIDTARKYGSEPAVGEAIKIAGVPRNEIFLTTKVSHENLRSDDFARSVDESLAALNVDYIDLLLVHWPNPDIPLSETMPALANTKRSGLARHIGAANFNTALLEQALALCPEPLVALQAECHPYLDQSKLLPAVHRHGLVFIAYCPLGRGRLFTDPVLAEIAETRGRTIAQVALRWAIQQGVAVIPGSSNPDRIAGNFNIFDFALSESEMERISALKRSDGRIANPVHRVPGGWD